MNMRPQLMLQICLWLSVLFIFSKCGKTDGDGVIVFNISQHVVNIFLVKRELLEIIFHSFCISCIYLLFNLLVLTGINIIRYQWHLYTIRVHSAFSLVASCVLLKYTRTDG